VNQPTEHACAVGVASDMLICVPLLTVSGEVVILEVSCSRTVRLSVWYFRLTRVPFLVFS